MAGRGANMAGRGAPTDPRSALKPGPLKRSLSQVATDGQGNEKKPKVGSAIEQRKNSVALLHEYQSNIVFELVGQSGLQHAPQFTMRVVVDGRAYETTGGNKKKTKTDLADIVVTAIWPQIQEAQERRIMEKAVMDTAEKEYYMKLYPEAASSEMETDAAGETNEATPEGEEKKHSRRPKNALRVCNDLNLRPKYTDVADFADNYVVEAVLEGQTFQGHGSTKVMARALAVEQALTTLYGIQFEHTDDGYPMYVGEGSALKELRISLKKNDHVDSTLGGSSVSRRDKQADPAASLLVDGKNPIMVLNELFNAGVKYEAFECKTEPEQQPEYGCRAVMKDLSIEARGSTPKAAKVQACVDALSALKRNGTLARMVREKEQNCAGALRKPGSVWRGTAHGADCFPLHVTAAPPVLEQAPLPNSLAKLNNLFPGTMYVLLSSSEDLDNPWFEFEITVKEKKYTGGGRGKKAARSDAAENALKGLGLWDATDELAKKQALASHRQKEANKPKPDSNRPPRGFRGRGGLGGVRGMSMGGGLSMGGGMGFGGMGGMGSMSGGGYGRGGGGRGFGQSGFGRGGAMQRGMSRGGRLGMRGGRGGGGGLGYTAIDNSFVSGGNGQMNSGMRGRGMGGYGASNSLPGFGRGAGMMRGRGRGVMGGNSTGMDGGGGMGRGVRSGMKAILIGNLLSQLSNLTNSDAAYEYGGAGYEYGGGQVGDVSQYQSYGDEGYTGYDASNFGGGGFADDTSLSFMSPTPAVNKTLGFGRLPQQQQAGGVGGLVGRGRGARGGGGAALGSIRGGSMMQQQAGVGRGRGGAPAAQQFSSDEIDYASIGSTGFQSFSSGAGAGTSAGNNWNTAGNGNGWSGNMYPTDTTGNNNSNNASAYSTGMTSNTW